MQRGAALRTLALAAFLGIGLAAYATTQAPADGNAARGGAIVQESCGRCHATGRTGDSPAAGAPPFRELSRNYPVESLEEALAEGIMVSHEGVTQMPEFAFSPEDVAHIIAYLKSIQSR